MNLTPELEELRAIIAEDARGYGLDFYETVFEILDYDELNEVASYLGFPTRYPHWRFGMEYERLSKSYSYGLSKIYELVINNDPCYAYLMRSNAVTDQKMVMAHVYGHCDFFKNNLWFSQTNRKMVDQMANHATRLRRYIDRFGLEPVELFLDSVLSLENLIDQHSPFIQRRDARPGKEEPVPTERLAVAKLRSKDYMDEYINPTEFLEQQRKRIEDERARQKRVPESPQKDLLLFLIEHAPLEEWQLDVLAIVREEAYYFAPQAQTKIMNEGWASYWHSTIMTERQLKDSEVIDYADHHSGTMGMRPGVVNPYKIGLELFRDIEDRWNKGKFGREYDECAWEERRRWDKKVGLGREKIFEVRRVYNDVAFIDAFLTPEFCEQHRLFTYGYESTTGRYVIVDRDVQKVKEQLLFQLTNFGDPFMYVVDANHDNRGELYLLHRHEGLDLRLDYARDVLVGLNRIWKRPVNLETIVEGKPKLLSFEGSEQRERALDEPTRIRF